MPVIRSIVETADSPAINLIALQSLVFFKDGPFSYDTTLDTKKIKMVDDQVVRRIGYLDGLSQAEVKKRTRDMNQNRKKAAIKK